MKQITPHIPTSVSREIFSADCQLDTHLATTFTMRPMSAIIKNVNISEENWHIFLFLMMYANSL